MKKIVAISLCLLIFTAGVFSGYFMSLGMHSSIPASMPVSTPTPVPTPTPVALEEIYEEFYHDIEDWEFKYPAHLWLKWCIDSEEVNHYPQSVEVRKAFYEKKKGVRQATKDFDIIVVKFLNAVEENGYENRAEEELFDYDDLRQMQPYLCCADHINDLPELCDGFGEIPFHFLPDLKEELRELLESK